MIPEVGQALRTWLRREAVGPDVDVQFDAPTRDWAQRRTSPTVDIFLFDVREATERRMVGTVPVLDEQGAVRVRRPQPRTFRLSYMVTAWATRVDDELELLDAVLRCCAGRDRVPPDLFAPQASSSALLSLAPPLGPDRRFADVWGAIGGDLRPSIDLVVTAPMDPGDGAPAAALVTERPVVSLHEVHGAG